MISALFGVSLHLPSERDHWMTQLTLDLVMSLFQKLARMVVVKATMMEQMKALCLPSRLKKK